MSKIARILFFPHNLKHGGGAALIQTEIMLVLNIHPDQKSVHDAEH